MSTCETGGREMPSPLCCMKATITFTDGKTFDRVPFMPAENDANLCAGCGVQIGGFHHFGCDREKCPRCRLKSIGSCRCGQE